MSPPASSREAILDAAEAVVIESGAGHMTLDAVAAKAGVSKGGLLYHFPTKEELLKAMLDRLLKQIDETWEQKGKGVKDGPGREIKATILTYADRDLRKEKIGSALLAAAAHDPRLLQPAREAFRRRLDKFRQSGTRMKQAEVIFFALHGLVLADLLLLSPLNHKERHEFLVELLRRAGDSETGRKGQPVKNGGDD